MTETPKVGPSAPAGGSAVSSARAAEIPRVGPWTGDRGQLTRAQVERLMTSIDPNHVESKRGMSYIAQHQARAEMTRVFGVGNWDSQVESMDLVYEYEQKGSADDGGSTGKNMEKTYYVTCYKASVRVNIRDYWGRPVASFLEYHAEANSPLPNRGEAHAMAITSVESYALRRALIGLGDRLGLGLYDKGQLLPLVKGTLQLSDAESPLYRARQAEETLGKVAERATAAQPAGSAHQAAFNQQTGEVK